MKRILSTIFILFTLSVICLGQPPEKLNVAFIPEALKKNADVVVRSSNCEYICKSDKVGAEIVSISMTVMNKDGEDIANFYYPGDKDRKLKSFAATLYDSKGKVLRKFKMSDVVVSEYSFGSLATDNRYYYLDIFAPTFPYTVQYDYEVAWSNGHLMFPSFTPQLSSNISVEMATYSLSIPSTMKIATHNRGAQVKEPSIEENKGITTYRWRLDNLQASIYEVFEPTKKDWRHSLLIRPTKFVYDNTPGDFDSWNSMGKWEYGLLVGRDELPDEAQTKIREITKNCTTDRQKVEALYQYLGQATRYVSMQLGIGGYQPMTATEVYKTGFGDCKALTNYMKAMLKVVGIESNYCPIYMGDDWDGKLYEGYPNFSSMNHVILQVPLKSDTLWLECTSTNLPFGYVHDGIAGHQALEVTSNGGRVVDLPQYADTLNLISNHVTIDIRSDGSAKGKMESTYHTHKYSEVSWIVGEEKTKQIDCVRREVKLPSLSIESLKITETKSSLPYLSILYDWSTTLYGNKSGSRVFIPVNPFRRSMLKLKSTKRTKDIELNYGMKQTDSIFVAIPADFLIEAKPSPILIESPFGSFRSEVRPSNGGLLIIQSLKLNSGLYPVSEWENLLIFTEKVNLGYAGMVTIRKRTAEEQYPAKP